MIDDVQDDRPEGVVFVGIQASGKSTFYREKFFDTHMRINLDMLRTRHREARFFATCLETRQAFVVDNTNPTRADRSRYLETARAEGYRIVGYYFSSRIDDSLGRNRLRPDERRVPDAGVLSTHARLELPRHDEGFDTLFYVRLAPDGGFMVDEWDDEV